MVNSVLNHEHPQKTERALLYLLGPFLMVLSGTISNVISISIIHSAQITDTLRVYQA
jgi:hypothetical protein